LFTQPMPLVRLRVHLVLATVIFAEERPLFMTSGNVPRR
jgi:hypothetical protein